MTGRRTIAIALTLALAGCAFAVKHPAGAAAIVGGAFGFTACEIDGLAIKTCGEITGIAAVGLGGIAALAMLLGPKDDEVPPDDDIEQLKRRHHIVVLPPPPVDAGVGDAAPAPVDAGARAVVADAPLD